MITTTQALLLALLAFFLKSTFSPNLTFYWSKPLITGMFVGIIMGDMRTALAVSISIQLVYIGLMGIGSVIPADTAIATIVGGSLAVCLAPQMGLEEAIATGFSVAVAVGTPAQTLASLVMVIDTMFNEKSKAAGLKGNTRAQRLWQWVPSQIINFCIYFPVVFIATKAMGSESFLSVIANVVKPISVHLTAMSKVLPAVGIALALRTVTTAETIPYIIIGFLLSSQLGASVLVTSLIGAMIAILVCFAEYRKQQEKEESDLDI